MLNQSTLVLEGVTLAQMVELVVEVLVDFAGSAILDYPLSLAGWNRGFASNISHLTSGGGHEGGAST